MFCSLDIVEGVKVIRNHFNTLIWVKLDKLLLNRDEDIYVCSAYVWEADSSVYVNAMSVHNMTWSIVTKRFKD